MALVLDYIPMIIIIIIIIIFGYTRRIYAYWKRRNVVFRQPTFPFGTLTHLITKKRYIGDIYEDDYKYFVEKDERYGGVYIFTSPALMAVNLVLIKDVMTKSFYYFNDRGFYCNEKHDPLSAHLLNLSGDKWKKMRGKLTAAFTSVKIKTMFETMLACSEQLSAALEEYVVKKVAFDVDDVMARFTTDVIGSCAFGLECNSFKELNCEFRRHGEDITRLRIGKMMLLALGEMNKNVANWFGITLTKSATRKFFLDIVRSTLAYRQEHGVTRKDFMQILLDLKNEDEGLTLEEITAQALLFFVAGFETSASTLTFCLYELSKHPDMQDRLREEIASVSDKHHEVSHEAIAEMSYLTQVIEEALRKYPPAGVVARKCLKDYQVPQSSLVIKAGIKVLISIQGLHHDPRYFSEPTTFDPERFSKENRSKIKAYTYLPFGEGPRSCIGAKFGVMQAKIGLVAMLRKFRFSLNAKTPDVLKAYYGSISLTFPKTVWVKAEAV